MQRIGSRAKGTQRVGSRAQVMHGNAKQTGGGLKKKDLKYNKQGKIVSKKMSTMAKKEKRLQKAGYTTKKGQFGAVRTMRGGNSKYTCILLKNYRIKKDNWRIAQDNEFILLFIDNTNSKVYLFNYPIISNFKTALYYSYGDYEFNNESTGAKSFLGMKRTRKPNRLNIIPRETKNYYVGGYNFISAEKIEFQLDVDPSQIYVYETDTINNFNRPCLEVSKSIDNSLTNEECIGLYYSMSIEFNMKESNMNILDFLKNKENKSAFKNSNMSKLKNKLNIKLNKNTQPNRVSNKVVSANSLESRLTELNQA